MKSILKLFFCLSFTFSLYAQDLEGLWLIESVRINDQLRTPESRWFRLSNGKMESGNGYLKNGAGFYEYNEEQGLLHLVDTMALIDPAGPFKLEALSSDSLLMSREEEGALVKVFCRRGNGIPPTTADKLAGLWSVDNGFHIYLSWDRSYRKYNTDGSVEHGVWRNHPHKNELALLPWNRKLEARFYALSFKQGRLDLEDLKSDQQFQLKRLQSFPRN